MIDLGPHAAFILWAYLGVFCAIAGLVGWTVYDAHRTAKKLAALEAQRPAR